MLETTTKDFTLNELTTLFIMMKAQVNVSLNLQARILAKLDGRTYEEVIAEVDKDIESDAQILMSEEHF